MKLPKLAQNSTKLKEKETAQTCPKKKKNIIILTKTLKEKKLPKLAQKTVKIVEIDTPESQSLFNL